MKTSRAASIPFLLGSCACLGDIGADEPEEREERMRRAIELHDARDYVSRPVCVMPSEP